MKRAIPRIAVICMLVFCFMLQGCTVGDIIDNITPEKDKELTAEELYEKVSPSVVEVTGESASMTSTGTGFFYDDNGTVITNYHVIEKCTTAKITLSNGKFYEVGSDTHSIALSQEYRIKLS